jgi:hypothetical protein
MDGPSCIMISPPDLVPETSGVRAQYSVPNSSSSTKGGWVPPQKYPDHKIATADSTRHDAGPQARALSSPVWLFAVQYARVTEPCTICPLYGIPRLRDRVIVRKTWEEDSLGSIRSARHDHLAGWVSRPSGEFVPWTGGSPNPEGASLNCSPVWRVGILV